jgi:histidine triad (HIT) family protein
MTQRDVVRRSSLATALIAPRWRPNNHGHVLVVPNAHHENLYDLPSRYGHPVHDQAREVVIAVRQSYGCDGTSLRQHNEQAGAARPSGTTTSTSSPGTPTTTSTRPARTPVS